MPIGGGSSPIKGWIETGKNVHLDGYHALWFSRSRADSSDYARIQRQKCVMNAMLNQLEPVTVLTNFNKIASAGKEILATDIPPKVINQLAGLAGQARTKPISSVAMVPPLVYPGSPNFTKIHKTVARKIAAAEAVDQPPPSPPAAPATTAASPGAAATPQATAKRKKKKAVGTKPGLETDDLGSVCAAR